MQTSEHSPPAESCSISRSYGDASASFAAAPAKSGLRTHTASVKCRGFLIRRLGLRLLPCWRHLRLSCKRQRRPRLQRPRRNLADGPATRYIDGQVIISWPDLKAAATSARRAGGPVAASLAHGAPGGMADETGPAVAVRQRVSDYEGASYDLQARPLGASCC